MEDLKKYTKDELIWFIKDNLHMIPFKDVKKELNFYKWQNGMEKYKRLTEENQEFYNSINFNRRVELINEYNDKNNSSRERLNVLKEINKIDTMYKDYLDRDKKAEQFYKKIDKLLDL